jgi:hypothetical protein
MTNPLAGWGNPVTPRPGPGTCAVCHRPDSVPEDQRDRLPAFCSDACKAGWLELWDITSPATHVVDGDEWVPVTPLGAAVAAERQRAEDTADVLRPLTHARPAVDLAVAEAGPPVTPLTAAELEACRREKPAPRPVPGAWLRRVLDGVFR